MVVIASVSVEAGLRDLASLRHFVRKTAAPIVRDDGDIDDLVLATDEALTNVIVHGYGGRAGPITLEIGQDGESVLVRLRDQAPAFDPRTVPTPDTTLPLEQRRPGGMGVHLMRQLTDEMRYRALTPRGNEIILVKYGASAAPDAANG